MSLAFLAAAAIALTASLPVFAREALTNIRGNIESFEGSTLVVDSREGEVVTITLNLGIHVEGVAAASVADISVGDYVRVASPPNSDDGDRALAVLIS